MDVFFTHIDTALFQLGQEMFIGTDKPLKGILKGMETAFQTFDQKDFHELAHIFLGQLFGMGNSSFEIEQGGITGIFKLFGDHSMVLWKT